MEKKIRGKSSGNILFKQKTANKKLRSHVGSKKGIRDDQPTEASKSKKKTPEANASTQKRQKVKKNSWRPMLAHRSVKK